MTRTTPPGSIDACRALNGHEHVRQRERRAAHQPRQQRRPRRRPVHRDALLEEILREHAVPAEQVVGQHVRPNLFRGARLHQQVAEVLALALLRRLLVEEFVQPRRHAALERERQQRRGNREDHQDVVQAREDRRHQHDGDDVAGQAEDGPGEIAGPPRDVALRARQAVVPVGVVEVSDVHPRRLREQPPLGFELDPPDEQVAAVSHVGADGTLQRGREPQADEDGHHVAEADRLNTRLRDPIHQACPEIDRNRRHRGADHPENRVANQRPRRGGPGQGHAGPQIPPHSGGTAPRGGRNVHAQKVRERADSDKRRESQTKRTRRSTDAETATMTFGTR